jgi:hypothetical protein
MWRGNCTFSFTRPENKYDDQAFLYLQDENGERAEGDLL